MSSQALIGNLAVNLTMDTASFERNSKKASAETAQLGTKMERVAGSVGKLTGVLAAAGTALVAAGGLQVMRELVTKGLDYAKAMSQQAQVANASVKQFQEAAFAAKSVGIESEKLADIYKDVNDKIGEFLATGGGEMKDFFEKVAPKVGITAEAFRDLSGPDALQLYVSSLEKAGLTQQQMTFYMEALANDTTALLPLLRDNGKAYNHLAQDARDLGVVMDESLIAKAGDASNTMKKLNGVLDAKISIAVADNADSIIDLANALTALIDKAGGAVKAWQNWRREVAARQQEEFAKGWFISDGEREQYLSNARRLRGEADPKPAAPARWPKASGFGTGLPSNLLQRGAVDPRFAKPYTGILKAQLGVASGTPFAGAGVAGGLAAISQGLREEKSAIVGAVTETVDDIAGQMRRLDAAMVQPARSATKLTGDAFRQLAADVAPLLDRLFPDEAALNAYRAEAELLARAEAGGAINADQAAEARRRLAMEGRDNGWADRLADWNAPIDGLDDLSQGLLSVTRAGEVLVNSAESVNVRIVQSFADMAKDTLASLNGLANSIRSGGFLEIFTSVVDLVLQLGSIGVFGKGIQGNLAKSFGGARANGGPVVPGKTYLVGENGPEWFSPGAAGGQITPMGGAGGSTVRIVPSPYFEAVVDGRAARVAGPMAMASGQYARAAAGGDIQRRSRRRIPG